MLQFDGFADSRSSSKVETSDLSLRGRGFLAANYAATTAATATAAANCMLGNS